MNIQNTKKKTIYQVGTSSLNFNNLTIEAIKTIKINQSARFKPKASILIFLHLKTQKLTELNPCC